MRGYVQNNGSTSKFTAQRRFHPGGRVDFDNLIPTFIKLSGFSKSSPGFVKWLRDNIFSDERWGFYNADGSDFKFTKSKAKSTVANQDEVVTEESAAPVKKARGAGQRLTRNVENDISDRDITPSSIINAEFSMARPQIEKCRDRIILKRALTLSKHFSNKEEHMRYLMRRLDEIY